MRRSPAALVLLLGLSGTRTAGAEPCAPMAQRLRGRRRTDAGMVIEARGVSA